MTTHFATSYPRTDVTVLGLGAMGSALASRLLDIGYHVTVWNRSPGRDTVLVESGAHPAETVAAAAGANPLIVACLLRATSVYETLTPVVEQLRGRTLINLTTTTPNEARALADWADRHGIAYLTGAILAVPDMIGTPAAQIFYSGPQPIYEQHHELLDTWATSTYDGADPGMASLVDLAMLSGMYQMFAGFFHGAAMVGSEGMTAEEFARRATPFLRAMTSGFREYAAVIDAGDYTAPGQQSLEFSDLGHIVSASEEQCVDPATLVALQGLITREIAAGHGSEGFARVFESMRADTGDRTAERIA